jgi:hypothetical protein
MQLWRTKWPNTPAIFIILLATRMSRGCRQLQTPQRIQLSEGVSTVKRRATMLMCAPNHDHTPIRCHQPTHHPIEVPTLFPWLIGRTLLEEESTKWLLNKLRMLQWMVQSSSTRIPFYSFLDLLSFLLWESRGQIPFKGGSLVTPQNSEF